MKQTMQRSQTRRIFLCLLGTAVTVGLVQNRVGAELLHDERPPRPTPNPTASIIKESITKGASIQLWPSLVSPTLWTVVQWIDSNGKWHDVEGWRGELNHPYYVSWHVDENHFGKGPFQWVVYDDEGGEILGISKYFHLPTNNGEIKKIDVKISAGCTKVIMRVYKQIK